MDKNKIKVSLIKDGPLMVEGELKIFDHNGEKVREGQKLFLCRCGQSSNKPFCDGSHKKAGFQG